MRYDANDSQSNDSDVSSDSQSSQISSGTDFVGPTSNLRMSTSTLAQLDGLNSGVPTRTTATLTPTTLRSIEQTFIELQCQVEQHSSQAGFVPPPLAPSQPILQGNQQSQSIGFTGGHLRVSPGPGSSSCSSASPSPSLSPAPPPQSSSSSSSSAAPRRRGMGGRRPNASQPRLSPEEEERRNMRRERNKMAAARCRKRRLDHTNELVEETDGLERKKQSLQAEIRQLQHDREELQFILDSHRACCRLQTGRRAPSPPDVKPAYRTLAAAEPKRPDTGFPREDEPVRVKVEMVEPPINLDADVFTSPQTNKRVMLSSANPQVVTHHGGPAARPSRPNFLNVPLSLTPAQAHGLKHNPAMMEVAGVAITTPSNGIPFNFDSLMEGGTGLTPVQPCATQQHKSQPEMGSIDTMGNNKLTTL